VILGEAHNDDPPPYEARAETTCSIATSVEDNKPRQSSAHLFVVGSSLFTVVAFDLFIIALWIQYTAYCAGAKSNPALLFVLWAFYAALCSWASVGLLCWVRLLRDLWGPATAKRYPINIYLVCYLIPGVIVGIPMLLVKGLGRGAVIAVEACQRKFCGDALEEDEEAMECNELEEAQGLVGAAAAENEIDGESSPRIRAKMSL